MCLCYTYHVLIITENERKKIIPFAGGKGGVGKTFIATNIAIRLASQGRKVILIDLDLGGSNAHTYLHIKNQHYGIANYSYNEQLAFGEIIQETEYPNLHFIAGDVLMPRITSIDSTQIDAILNEIIALSYDYIIIDLSSGSTQTALDTFSIVNSGILVTSPSLPSILNTYNFFKNVVFNIIYRYTLQEHRDLLTEYIDTIFAEQLPNSTPKINEILLEIEKIDSHASAELREMLYSLKPFLVLNGVQSEFDLAHAENLKNLILKNMNIELEFLGVVFEDVASIKQAAELNVPLISSEINSHARNNIDRIAQKILLSPDFPILPLDFEMYASTFELVDIEMQQDMEEKPSNIGALEREEYRALIESLQQKIAELESKENNEQVYLPHSGAEDPPSLEEDLPEIEGRIENRTRTPKKKTAHRADKKGKNTKE